MSSINVFNLIADDVERQQAEETKPESLIRRIFTIEELWKFRPNYIQEPAMDVLVGNAENAQLTAIQARQYRASAIVDAYRDVERRSEQQTGQKLFSITVADTEDLSHIFNKAAKFDFMGINMDPTFDVLEFVLTHENALFIYEVIDWHVDNIITPLAEAATARDKIEVCRDFQKIDLPEPIQLAMDAYALYTSAKMKALAKTEFGYVDDQPTAADTTTSEDVLKNPPPVPSRPDHQFDPLLHPDTQSTTQPAQTVSVDAKPVQDAQHKGE